MGMEEFGQMLYDLDGMDVSDAGRSLSSRISPVCQVPNKHHLYDVGCLC